MKRRLQPKYPLKRFTDAAALRATHARYRAIDVLLQEIIMLWGDVDQGLVDRADGIREAVRDASLDATLVAQMRAEEADAAGT